MKEAASKNSNIFFLAGMFFINMVAAILLLSAVTFIGKATISSWQFPLALVISTAINYFAAKHFQTDFKVFLKSILIVAIVVAGSLFIAGYFYDTSYDGQSYHQETIFQLANGWNPFTTILPDSVNQAIYINHYSKGVEIPQSAIYGTLHYIEAGKATNIILLFAAFCLTLSYVFNTGKLSVRKCVLLSLLITLNPVAINQVLTYYVDGQLATLLLCFVIAGLLVIKEPNRYHLLLLGSVIIITANIKFTALVYVVVFALGLLAWAILTKKAALAKKLFATVFIAGILGVVVVGYNPYIKNTVNNGHPFYPLMGKNKIDIMTVQFPKGFKEKNTAEKFFISTFAHTDDSMPWEAHLKVPLTLNKNDIVSASKVDTHIAGFGPFFSGILLLSCALFVIAWFGTAEQLVFKNILYVIVVIALSVCINPEAWWARYIPQLWFVPVIILLAAEFTAQKRAVKLLKPVIYVLLALNIGFSLIGIGWSFLLTSLVNYQLAQLKASGKTISVQWGVAKANRIRFMEHHIPYVETNLDHAKPEFIIHSDSKFISPGNSSLPKPALVKWAQKLTKEGK